MEVIGHGDMTANLLKLIGACELDLVVLSIPIPERGFDTQVLFKEELLLAVPSKHPFAVKDKVYLADLDKERFILMKDGQPPASRAS